MSIAMEDFPRRHGITVDEYFRMHEAGEIAPDARVELIDGEIIDMPPIGSPHAATDSAIVTLLVRAVGERAQVRCGSPTLLGNMSVPQPDFTLVAPRKDFYFERHPTAADTFLAIEVSYSRLSFDLGKKMQLYARHGIPELWVLDLKRSRLHVFRQPSEGKYLDVSVLEAPSSMTIEKLPGLTLDLSSIYIR